jgi:hypothetical protein
VPFASLARPSQSFVLTANLIVCNLALKPYSSGFCVGGAEAVARNKQTERQ